MRPDPVVEFCLGLGAIIAALAVALMLAFPPAWMDSRQGAVANFTNVDHLVEGSNVTRSGVVWGTVTGIQDKGNFVLVHMKLKPGFTMAPDQGLALEDTNPVQPASLVVGRRCKLIAGEKIPEGCCPEKITGASSTATEIGLASCGHLPSLIDQAQEIGRVAKAQIGAIGKTVSDLNDKLTPLMAKASATLDTSKATMASALGTSEKAKGALSDQNVANLTKVLASTEATMDRVKTTTANIDDIVRNEKEQLDASIANVSTVLATTAAMMPGVVDNLQKSAENMRAITGDIRQEPTSLVRRRERSDPSFVEPAGK
jgi:ABC-type transporter Mla subunit MlaD